MNHGWLLATVDIRDTQLVEESQTSSCSCHTSETATGLLAVQWAEPSLVRSLFALSSFLVAMPQFRKCLRIEPLGQGF